MLKRALARLEHRVAKAAVDLVPRVPEPLWQIVGKRADGLMLNPELQVLLLLRDAVGTRPLAELTIERARAQLRREALVHSGRKVSVGEVRELRVGGATSMLRARHYVPADADPTPPLLVFFHGGGFVVGDLDTHDQPCRVLCQRGRMHVLSVEYRLAPEHPFPAAIDDGHAALRWARSQAALLGADPERIAVGGDSAGANIAAVVTQLTARAGEAPPALQLLIYPSADRIRPRPSLHLFSDGFFLTQAELEWFTHHYTGIVNADMADPRISPLLADDLSGLSPALVITAGFDPLRDEGEAYATALRDAGNHAKLVRFPDLVHGFLNMGGLSRGCRRALETIADEARALLTTRDTHLDARRSRVA